MKKNFLYLCILFFISCNDDNKKVSDFTLNENTIDSFRNDVTKYEFKRYKYYGNDMDEMIIEHDFRKILTGKYAHVKEYPVQIIGNFLDTGRDRRNWILMDSNAIFFNGVSLNNDTYGKYKAFSYIKITGGMLGFKIKKDTTNPGLETPSFYIDIDTIIENHSK